LLWIVIELLARVHRRNRHLLHAEVDERLVAAINQFVVVQPHFGGGQSAGDQRLQYLLAGELRKISRYPPGIINICGLERLVLLDGMITAIERYRGSAWPSGTRERPGKVVWKLGIHARRIIGASQTGSCIRDVVQEGSGSIVLAHEELVVGGVGIEL